MPIQTKVDITPSPRILRILGEIPFKAWQCFAELVDNAIDALVRDGSDTSLGKKRVIVSWSSDTVPDKDWRIEIVDTASGMTQEQLKNAVRAGYSSNDPTDALGLFGMGFNISTARLGERTAIYTTTLASPTWIVLSIDFEQLQRGGTFEAPVAEEQKTGEEHGTRIVISRLKPAIISEIKKHGRDIKRLLSDIYTPILQKRDLEIIVQGTKLESRPHCTWSEERFVVRRSQRIQTIQRIDSDLGQAFFYLNKNRYLTPAEEDEIRISLDAGNPLPGNVVQRHKKIVGWIGIQRYGDTDDFGIDFVRNGRKILIRDKSLFYYQNALTGRNDLEYPIELPGTFGGRIVGEISVDHLTPNYQKNDFDRNDLSWAEISSALRGTGPILPRKRTDLGFEDSNVSPIATLVNAYRRCDQGTRDLVAPNSEAKRWADKFREGDQEFQSDQKWYDAALTIDREGRAGPVNRPADQGDSATDDAAQYLPSALPTQPPQPVAPTPALSVAPTIEQVRDEIITRSRRVDAFSHEYRYATGSAFDITVYELQRGQITRDNERVLCRNFADGFDNTFVYDSAHPALANYAFNPQLLILFYLAERFKARENLDDFGPVLSRLLLSYFDAGKIDINSLRETASSLFERIRQAVPELLASREQQVMDVVHESVGEVEEIAANLLHSTELLQKFQTRGVGSIQALVFAPPRTLIRIVNTFPEEFFDGKLFTFVFDAIRLPDAEACRRLKEEAKERAISYLKDANWVLNSVQARNKEEMLRCSQSLNLLVANCI